MVISASSDVFLSSAHGRSQVGSPDFKVHWELTLLKDFVSQNAKDFSFLPELSDAL